MKFTSLSSNEFIKPIIQFLKKWKQIQHVETSIKNNNYLTNNNQYMKILDIVYEDTYHSYKSAHRINRENRVINNK
jgi:hypothetical protein